MLGYTHFLKFIYLHHAEKVDALKCSKTFFFGGTKIVENLEPQLFFSSKPALLQKKTWLENCCVVDST